MPRGLLLGSMVLAVAMAAAADTGTTEAEPRWGAGWIGQASAPTVRVRLGAWQVGLAARPSDDLDYVERWDDDPYGQSTPDSLRDVPQDDKVESGWVRLDLARRAKRWDRVDLAVMVAFAYSWRDRKDESRYWRPDDQGYDISTQDEYTNSYELILGLRPCWRIRPWVSLETEFGVRFAWSNYDRNSRRSRPNQEEDEFSYERGHGKSFTGYGWSSGSGIGLASLVFWF